MKSVHYYEADDGTRFDDEFECMEYEFNQKLEKYGVMFFNNLMETEVDPANAKYVYIDKKLSREILEELYSMYGADIPEGPGMYEYRYELYGTEDGYYPYKDKEFIANLYAQQHGIIDYKVNGNRMIWYTDHTEGTYKVTIRLDALQEERQLLSKRNKRGMYHEGR